jgi:hypothetical protein
MMATARMKSIRRLLAGPELGWFGTLPGILLSRGKIPMAGSFAAPSCKKSMVWRIN